MYENLQFVSIRLLPFLLFASGSLLLAGFVENDTMLIKRGEISVFLYKVFIRASIGNHAEFVLKIMLV